MKRVNLFMIAAVYAVSSVFFSCAKVENDPPTIDVYLNGTQQTTLEVDPGLSVTVKIDFKADAKIKVIEINPETGAQILKVEKDFSPSNTYHVYNGSIDDPRGKAPYSESAAAVDVIWYIKITDKDDQTMNQKVTVTFKPIVVVPPAGDIDTWKDKVLGSLSHASTDGSSCASIDGSVYTLSQASANSAKVDFIYFNGSTNPLSLAAPSNSAVQTISSNAVAGWATKNATKLGKLTSVTAAQFDDCEDDALITTSVTTTAVSADIVSSLAVGNVIGFITASGKKGLIKVVTVSTGGAAANESIKIDIKVQK